MIKKLSIKLKIMLLTLLTAFSAVLLVSLFFPDLFFAIMREKLIHQTASQIYSVALRESYIWQGNNRLKDLTLDTEFASLIQQWYSGTLTGEKRAQIYHLICSYLPINPSLPSAELTGSPSDIPADDTGYIHFRDFFGLLTDRGDLFGNPSAAQLLSLLQQSEAFRALDLSVPYLGHLPSIFDAEQDTYYMPVIETFNPGDVHCAVVRMVCLADILRQFDELERSGIHDYLICSGDTILYRSPDTTLEEDNIIGASPLCTSRQYEVSLYDSSEKTIFSVLCTYISEDLRLYISVPHAVMLAPYRNVFFSFRVLLVVFAVILLALFWAALNHSLRRLTRLERKMQQVQKGHYPISISDPAMDEIGSLTRTFQLMIDQLNDDIQEKEQMQYLLLVSAIDPHYLYNTLNTVTALAELGRTSEVAAVNNALIGTLKDRLRMKNYKVFDTVRAEKNALDQYMIIQRYMVSIPIRYQFVVQASDESLIIPKNILQPFVENAIKHGILCQDYSEETGGEGQIDVSVLRQEEEILLTVRDNGIGMSPELLKRYFSSTPGKRTKPSENAEHIGIFNVLMRLDYLYGHAYRVSASSQIGQGLSIEIRLPMRPLHPQPGA